MKFIESPELSRLADLLSHESPECSTHTRIEAYSCKNVKRDKKLFKSLELAYNDEVSHSPPIPSWLASSLDRDEITPFGPFDKHSSRKTLYLLIACLNVAFPDYDFSDLKHAHFNKEQSGSPVLNSLSDTLVSPPHHRLARAPRTYGSYPPPTSSALSQDFSPPPSRSLSNPAGGGPGSGTHPTLYNALDRAIGGLAECEVFSYSPDLESDPHAGDDLSPDSDFPSPTHSSSDSDSGADDAPFEFDDYDVDEHRLGGRSRYALPIPRTRSPLGHRHHHSRGALLWSSHWFFLNRKLKRILYVTIWSRSRGFSSFYDPSDSDLYEYEYGSEDVGSKPSSLLGESGVLRGKERFNGWEGGEGAGARALGLTVSV